MRFLSKVTLAAGALAAVACGGSSSSTGAGTAPAPAGGLALMARNAAITAPSPDPRVGLKAGLQDAGEAIWNLRMISHTPPPEHFAGVTNSDLAFYGTNVIQGNYNGFQIWDISNPAQPRLRVARLCPASQSDVSVYRNLLFVSAEAPTARLDCGATAPSETVSKDRIRGVRIFDISDIDHPKYLANVQSCRGSHTHTVVTDPNDKANIYIYISGTSGIRPAAELPGCQADPNDPNTSWFNIEVIRIPLAHPEQAAIVSHARIFSNGSAGELRNTLGTHGAPPSDVGGRGGRGRGAFRLPAPTTFGRPNATGMAGEIAVIPAPGTTAADSMTYTRAADSLRAAGYLPEVARFGRGGRGRGGAPTGPLTAGDSMRIWSQIALAKVAALSAASTRADTAGYVRSTDSLRARGFQVPFLPPPRGTLTQCHDITAYPSIGLAGGACAGMGLLLDIHDAANPRRIDAVADTNFSFWHSATFSNDGSMVLFSDEWGGGGAAYCRATDPKEWGGDAIFTIVNGKMTFRSYYKMPAAQTPFENCVAHNGSLIPIPGRTVMVQAWYQGGISLFEWSDPAHPREIAFFDRGPNDGTRLMTGGFWSAYWYNGHIVGSEIERGLDVFDLTPSAAISQNEIDAAKSVQFEWENVQDQPKFVWPASFALSRAYVDQLERDQGLLARQIAAVRTGLSRAEGLSGRRGALSKLAAEVEGYASDARDAGRVRLLAASLKELAGASPTR